MRGTRRLIGGLLVASLLAGCGGSMDTGPSGGPPGGGNGGGGMGGGGGGGPAQDSVSITVGNFFFRSDRNGSRNPAVDTVSVGGKVTWVWAATGNVPHNVQSVGTPNFTSGGIATGDGSTYEFTFTAPGTYRYNCAVHGDMMTGMVVVTAR